MNDEPAPPRAWCPGQLCSTMSRNLANPPTDAAHPCPYQIEINDDIDFRCHCCPRCELECQDGI
jgi:hypothetical protein